MFIIFGWNHCKKQDFGEAIPLNCNCNVREVQMFHYFRVTKFLHFFFIPILPYNREEYLICPNCDVSRELEDEEEVFYLRDMVRLTRKLKNKEVTKKKYLIEVKKYNKILKRLESS